MKSNLFRPVLPLVAALSFFSCAPVFAQIQRYDAEATRELLLSIPEKHTPTPIQLKGYFKSAKAKTFVEYYLKSIRPVLDSIHKPILTYRAYKLLLDSGSYTNDAEKDQWIAEIQKSEDFLNQLDVDPSWTEKLKRWSQLSRGLKGDLPEIARREYRERELFSFAPEFKGKLDEIAQLDREFDIAINEAPANQHLAQFQKERADAARLYKDGKISYAEAKNIIDHNTYNYGFRFVAFEALQVHPDHLNRKAVLRSELAKSKGFKTWAALQLSGDEGYSKTYRGVETQRQFLLNLLEKLGPALDELISSRIQELGLKESDVKNEHISVVLPQGVGQLRLHYPAEDLTDIWLESMKESGFADQYLSQILIDDKQRPNKNATGAYMATALSPAVDIDVLNLQTLNFVSPKKTSKAWMPGLTYILQSYKIGGTGDLETMFHEGGHALEKTAKYKNKSTPEAYAYVETPSMTMEHFLQDPTFLEAKARLVEGKKPDLAEFQRLVKNSKLAAAFNFLHLAAGSLFDIDLWDYDYSAPGAKSFMERVQELDSRIAKLTLSRGSVESKVPSYFGLLSTSHYTSGQVRNIGYVFAEMSSQQMANFISETLEKRTGRRSWLKQPALAKIFNDRFFAEGWKKAFPENIESITGRKYDPVKILESMLAEIQDCNQALKD